jgi:hypothetical protein
MDRRGVRLRSRDGRVTATPTNCMVSIPRLKVRMPTTRSERPSPNSLKVAANLRLGVLRIGDVAVGSVDGEVYSAIGKRWKEESPVANTIMVTLANGTANSGYIPDNASFGAYTFQVLNSRLKPGWAEDAIVGGMMNLVQANDK